MHVNEKFLRSKTIQKLSITSSNDFLEASSWFFYKEELVLGELIIGIHITRQKTMN